MLHHRAGGADDVPVVLEALAGHRAGLFVAHIGVERETGVGDLEYALRPLDRSQQGSVTTIVRVWRRSCTCCAMRCRGLSCRRSRGGLRGRRVGGASTSGIAPVSGSGCCRGCRSCSSRRGSATGRGRLSMPHWWMRKRGRPGRAVAAGPLWEPFPSSRRRVRGAICDPDRRRQRERATPPVAAARRAARTRTAAGRAVGRPRLRRRGVATAAARTRRRARDQPTAPARRT